MTSLPELLGNQKMDLADWRIGRHDPDQKSPHQEQSELPKMDLDLQEIHSVFLRESP
jgi:hypothetical protein